MPSIRLLERLFRPRPVKQPFTVLIVTIDDNQDVSIHHVEATTARAAEDAVTFEKWPDESDAPPLHAFVFEGHVKMLIGP